MRKFVKIVLATLLVLLVVFAVIADLPIGEQVIGHLDLALYLKLISLLGMVIALFFSMGYKQNVSGSHKYRRAKQVLSDAQEKAEQKKEVLEKLEDNLKATYALKEQELNRQINAAQVGYETRLKALKQQNLELKESVAKLTRALKRERQNIK